MTARVLVGNCLALMPTLDAESVDAVVCDPPYHLTTGKKGGSGDASVNLDSPYGRARVGTGFMGKQWDGGDVAFRSETWAAVLRVAKPGAHLVAFGGTRTYHRLTCAIEDAGWEIRDCLSWLYGSGFPKSLDVSKALDKSAGHWRVRASAVESGNGAMAGPNYGRTDKGRPVTDGAAAWDGWGTALKPAWEPIILARKPLIGTVAANVTAHSTGALNIDACRVKFASAEDQAAAAAAAAAAQRSCRDQNENRSAYGRFENGEASLAPYLAQMDKGRWPANVVLDEAAAELLDEMSGDVKGAVSNGKLAGTGYEGGFRGMPQQPSYGDTGGASRFFYTAKASASEREAGLAHLAAIRPTDGRDGDTENPRLRTSARKNHHPTVKPLDLMRWLVKLVTPPGGVILDPFAGSGSTGCAAELEGFDSVLMEREPEYAEIISARVAHARAQYQPTLDLGGAA